MSKLNEIKEPNPSKKELQNQLFLFIDDQKGNIFTKNTLESNWELTVKDYIIAKKHWDYAKRNTISIWDIDFENLWNGRLIPPNLSSERLRAYNEKIFIEKIKNLYNQGKFLLKYYEDKSSYVKIEFLKDYEKINSDLYLKHEGHAKKVKQKTERKGGFISYNIPKILEYKNNKKLEV